MKKKKEYRHSHLQAIIGHENLKKWTLGKKCKDGSDGGCASCKNNVTDLEWFTNSPEIEQWLVWRNADGKAIRKIKLSWKIYMKNKPDDT